MSGTPRLCETLAERPYEPGYADGVIVGRLGSGGWGYTVRRNIGYAYQSPALGTRSGPQAMEVAGLAHKLSE